MRNCLKMASVLGSFRFRTYLGGLRRSEGNGRAESKGSDDGLHVV